MNLNKYTKAELISKLKINHKKDSTKNTQSIWSKIITQLLILKNILIKITLIVTIIKIFKKYRFIRAIWLALNSIVMTIFGISLIDNFGIDFISKFFNEIRFISASIVGYFANTHFYSFIAGLFSSKEDISNERKISLKDRSMIEENGWETKRNESKIGENKGNSKISEWLNPDKKPTFEEENNYYYLLLLLLLAGLTWYYSDEILEFIKRYKPGDDDGNVPLERYWYNKINIPSKIKDYFKKWRSEKTDSAPENTNIFPFKSVHNSSQETIKPIELEDKTQIASSSNVLVEELKPVSVQVTGLPEISADNWENAALSLPGEIDNYFKYVNDSGFPKAVLQTGLAKVLSDRLHKLSWSDPEKYSKLLMDPSISNKFNNFLKYEKELVNEEVDVWSDRANSPSPTLNQESISQILSPIIEQESINPDEEEVISPNMLSYSIEDQQVQDYRRALSPVEQEVLIQSQEFQQAIYSSFNRSEQLEQELAQGPITPAQITEVLTTDPISATEVLASGPRTSTQLAEEIISGTSRSAEEIAEEMIAGPSNQTTSTISVPPSLNKRMHDDINKLANEENNTYKHILQDTAVRDAALKIYKKQMNTDSYISDNSDILNKKISALKSDVIEKQSESSYVPNNQQPIASSSSLPAVNEVKLDDQGRFLAKDKGKGREILESTDIQSNLSIAEPVNSESIDESVNNISTLSNNKEIDEKSPLLSVLGLGLNSPIIRTPLQAIKNLFSSTDNKLEDTENLFDIDSTINSPCSEDVTIEEGSKTLTKKERDSIEKILLETGKYDSDIVIDKIKEIMPNFNADSYRDSFMKAMDIELSSAKTVEERAQILKEVIKYDKQELEKIAGTSNLNQIRNAIRENYTHNTLLKELKFKTSKSSINVDK